MILNGREENEELSTQIVVSARLRVCVCKIKSNLVCLMKF